MRLMQHKREAFWFYRFLSIFYDKYVNPLFWTRWMRDQALQLAQLNNPNLEVIDVGSGTGFTTQGIVRKLSTDRITCVDQSPHQLAKAKKKKDLKGCTFQLGDAENIPFPTDHFDRYVSAGSIEYWPNPQQGIYEAYRVIKPGGIALLIGPLEPQKGVQKFMANTWMLFPKEEEYRKWYKKAGFTDIEIKYVRPHWHKGANEYGIAIAGVKPVAGLSPNAASGSSNISETEEPMTFIRTLQLIGRLFIGSLAGFFFIPLALLAYLWYAATGQQNLPEEYREKLNTHQIAAIILIVALLIWGIVA
ncbi:MAG: hypothetical protein DHS20C18_51330 [Saprospiraceae bacterium]|nr:MAG: hypothetical protein DHS20C18_51330 [Saprospiraceae bacterium]